MNSDCLIIGGGLIGMLTARELTTAGMQVTVLERGATGRESSWAGGGILSPLYPWRFGDAVTDLAAWSQAHYEALAGELTQDTGIDPEWTQSGLLVLNSGAQEEAAVWAARTGTRLETVSREAVFELDPGLARPGNWHDILRLPEVAQVRNPRLMQALRADLERRAVRISEGSEVQRILATDGRVTGVNTVRGRHMADRVVLAGGAWSSRLLQGVGLELDVVPVRGQMLLYRAEPGLVRHILLYNDRYLIPRRDGRVLAGSTLEYTGFDKSTTQDARRVLEQSALALVPELARWPVEHHWAGLRPGSPQGIPTIGEHPRIQGLFINTGHFRNGVVLGLASARLLADLLLARRPVVDPAPYRPAAALPG